MQRLPLLLFPLLLLLFLLLGVAPSTASDKRYVIRSTLAGPIGGYTEQVLDRNVSTFLGIPFALPPVGPLRFKPPEPYTRWTHVLNATGLPASCYQDIDTDFDRFKGVEMWNPNTAMSEDCLYLNVWQPHSSSRKKAVMVWIYGGGFFSGTSTLEIYDGRILAAKGDVVVISMQYRLGALGFLYLGVPDAPGNQGLLDQNLALKWIHENVAYFDGDPDRVTVFGESAGACSASLHLISPLSRNLIKSAIMESASAIAPWGLSPPTVAKKTTKILAEKLGCDKKSESDVVKCLRGIPPQTIIEKQGESHNHESLIQTSFVATIDGHFLVEDPKETLKRVDPSPHKSILLGVNRDEGYYFLAYQQREYFGVKKALDVTEDVYRSIVQKIVKVPSGQTSLLAESVAFEYGAPYFLKDSAAYKKALDDIYGDISFKCPVEDFARSYAVNQKTAVYLYDYNHRTSASPWPLWMGVMHGYEIDHVFGAPLNRSRNYTQDEVKLSQQMIRYWTNFAKTGNPNIIDHGSGVIGDVIWPPYKINERQILVLESRGSKVQRGLRDRQCHFWRTLAPRLRAAAGGSNPGSGSEVIFHYASKLFLISLIAASSFFNVQYVTIF